jgi:Fic family protein
MLSVEEITTNNHFESAEVLKALSLAHRFLGELKGLCQSIPNQAILVNTLTLQEAQDSSEIESIITTQDEIYKHLLQPKSTNKNIATKEVAHYREALNALFTNSQADRLITINKIIAAQKIIKGNNAGVRKLSGTVLTNEKTNEVVYTPPPPQEINHFLMDLEIFINDNKQAPHLDPIIKMAIIHHQFESIHPFYDGNGRIGRMLNIIYLIQQGLLDTPVLYLSRYINHNKTQYYQLLQAVRDNNSWEQWLLFMINGVAKTAQSTLSLIHKIKTLQQRYKLKIREEHPKIYSQDLLNNIFKNPYTKIAFLKNDLQVSRLTASRYLDELNKSDILIKKKLGKENYYFNAELISLLSNTGNLSNET